MKTSTVFPVASSFLFLASTTLAQDNQNCPILGPNFPAASDPLSSKAVNDAQESFPKIIEEALSSGLLDNKTTSFSITVFSASDNSTLYTQHFSAPGDGKAPTSGKLDDDTVYRIGSVSKLVTAYALLVKNGMLDFNEPVLKYLPELSYASGDDVDTTPWHDVTVGALASHMAGIARDYGILDQTTLPGNNASKLEKAGLPPLEESQGINCGFLGKLCTQEELLAGVASQRPVTNPYNVPIYSNTGYVLLGMVIERVTNMTYADAVKNLLFEPLGLERTSAVVPGKENAIIAGGDPLMSLWGVDIGVETAAGGVWSSLCDMRSLLLSILNNSLLSKSLTRQWMKPQGYTADPSIAQGLMWEIVRVEQPLTLGSSVSRITDLYTKAGDLGAYSSVVGLAPDQNIGFVVLTAGAKAENVRTALGSLVVETWVAAGEWAAREEAEKKLVGSYELADANSTLKLSLDPQKPGIGVEYTHRGRAFSDIFRELNGGAKAAKTIDVRMYPMGTSRGNGRVGFRAALEALPIPEQARRKPYAFGGCKTWLVASQQQYAGIALDDFEVVVDGEGRGTEVRAKGFREVLKRVEE